MEIIEAGHGSNKGEGLLDDKQANHWFLLLTSRLLAHLLVVVHTGSGTIRAFENSNHVHWEEHQVQEANGGVDAAGLLQYMLRRRFCVMSTGMRVGL